jgi:hypothetical protein
MRVRGDLLLHAFDVVICTMRELPDLLRKLQHPQIATSTDLRRLYDIPCLVNMTSCC